MREIYLDNSATTPLLPEVIAAINEVLSKNFGNPSSLHHKGVEAEKAVRVARERVAALAGAGPEEIFFTSGGTEANNWAVFGAARSRRRRGRHIITTSIEHPSILQPCKMLEEEGFEVTYLPVNKKGVIDPEDLRRALRPDTILVSIMHVNNEIGSVQPLGEISRILQEEQSAALFHVDNIQGLGKVPLPYPNPKIDLMTLSAHKLHGPKGTGALYIRRGCRISQLLAGGEQERGLRAGTENVPGIVGFGAAAVVAAESISDKAAEMQRLKLKLARFILDEIPGSRINGPEPEKGAPHILNVSFSGLKGEVLVHMLESRGVYVSTASACHSRRPGPSHVLQALGLSWAEMEGAIRISLSGLTTEEEIEDAARILRECVAELRQLG